MTFYFHYHYSVRLVFEKILKLIHVMMHPGKSAVLQKDRMCLQLLCESSSSGLNSAANLWDGVIVRFAHSTEDSIDV